MLPIHLVHAYVKGDLLEVRWLGSLKQRAIQIAEELIACAEAHIGRTRGELENAWRAIEVTPQEKKLRDGLIALLEKEMALEEPEEVDCQSLREKLFTFAAEWRKSGKPFDREKVIAAFASANNLSPDFIDRHLYGDLRSAQIIRAPAGSSMNPGRIFIPGGAQALVDRYDLAQAQSVLLRATKVEADWETISAPSLRNLLRYLKFHRLLWECTWRGESSSSSFTKPHLQITGPYSLFESTTRYGLALSLALPHLLASSPVRISAEILWGRGRNPCRFVIEAPHHLLLNSQPPPATINDEVQSLAERLAQLAPFLEITPAQTLFNIPGVGALVPDLTLRDPHYSLVVHIEILGFWNRDAVWKRAEAARAGLPEPIIFCASERLRVSECVMPTEWGASLYVYKQSISPQVILDRVKALWRRDVSAPLFNRVDSQRSE
ncbi:MAG: DUF790 family protein [Sandaracinaceae bacterium]|nr:DUF790 family protein [Sandaracinaceae bacterium]